MQRSCARIKTLLSRRTAALLKPAKPQIVTNIETHDCSEFGTSHPADEKACYKAKIFVFSSASGIRCSCRRAKPLRKRSTELQTFRNVFVTFEAILKVFETCLRPPNEYRNNCLMQCTRLLRVIGFPQDLAVFCLCGKHITLVLDVWLNLSLFYLCNCGSECED